MLSRLIFALTYRCQAQCVHCSAALYPVRRREELALPEIRRVLDEAFLVGVREVNFFGGEALLRRDLVTVLRYARKRASQLTVDSNGLLVTPEVAEKLADAGVDLVNLSLSGAYAETHDAHQRRPGNFTAVERATRALVERGVQVVYSTTAFRDIVQDGQLAQIVELGRARGVDGVRVLLPMCSGRWMGSTEALLTNAELAKVEELVDHRFVQVAEEEEGQFRRCHAVSSGTVYIGAYGEVQPCNFEPLYLGNIREEPLVDILERAQLANAFSDEERAEICPMQRPEYVRTLSAEMDGSIALARHPRPARIDAGGPCDLGCEGCQGNRAGVRSTEELLTAIAAADPRAGQIVLAGGEPSVRPDFIDLLRAARERVPSVVAHTHARVLAKPSRAEIARAAGLTAVEVPLFGATEAAHDAVTHHPGSFRQTLVGLRSLCAAGVHARVTLLSSDSPRPHARALLEHLDRIGVHEVRWDARAEAIVPPCGRPADAPPLTGAPARLVYSRQAREQDRLAALTEPLLAHHLGAGEPEPPERADDHLRALKAAPLPEQVIVSGPLARRRPHHLLLFPPVDTLEMPLRIWTLHYATHFPLALLKAASYLRQKGDQVTFLDAFNVYDESNEAAELSRILSPTRRVRAAPCGNYASEGRTRDVFRMGYSTDELRERLRVVRPAPDDIWISSIFTWTWRTTHEAVALCRELFPSARLRLGGVYPTLLPETARESGADEVVEGPDAEFDGSMLDTEYIGSLGRDSVALKTSQGCPFRCRYCAVHLLEGSRYTHRPAEEVLEELERLVDAGVRKVHLWESNLLYRPADHFERLLDGVIERELPLYLHAPEGLQPSLLRPGLAQKMRRAGFQDAYLTVETTDQERTREVRRPSSFEDARRALAFCREAGFDENRIAMVLLVGQPRQTLETICRDLVAVWKAGARSMMLVYTPIPGTEDFTTYQPLFAGRALEDLDSFLYPMAHEDMRTTDLDCLLERFNHRCVSEDEIRRWEPRSESEARVRERLRSAFAED